MPGQAAVLVLLALVASGVFLPICGYKLLKKSPIIGKLMLGVGIAIAFFTVVVLIRM